MGVQDLFDQRRAAAGMAAQKCGLPGGGSGRTLSPPAAQNRRGQLRQELPAPAVGLIITLFQQADIRDLADQRLGLAKPAHGLGVLAQLIEHDPQEVAAGIPDVGMPRLVLDELAERGFRLGIPAAAMEQKRSEVAGLVVPRLPGQARLDTFPRLIQTPLLFAPNRQADARVNRVGVGGHRTFISRARVVQLAEGLKLLPDHHQQRAVARRELDGPAVGFVGQSEIQFARGRVAELEPELGHLGVTRGQGLVSGQRRAVPAAEQVLLGALPAGQVAPRTLQLVQRAGHSPKNLPEPPSRIKRYARDRRTRSNLTLIGARWISTPAARANPPPAQTADAPRPSRSAGPHTSPG